MFVDPAVANNTSLTTCPTKQFASVTISDADSTNTQTLTVTLDTAAQAAIRALVFTPSQPRRADRRRRYGDDR